MKYRCIRNCFINGQIYLKGEEHELPDSMKESTKFQPLGELVAVEPESEPESEPTISEPPAEGYGDYLCQKCKVTHRAGSKVHKRHLKLL